MTHVFIPEEDRIANTEEFLDLGQEELFILRRQLRPKIKEKELLCPECYQPLNLAVLLTNHSISGM